MVKFIYDLKNAFFCGRPHYNYIETLIIGYHGSTLLRFCPIGATLSKHAKYRYHLFIQEIYLHRCATRLKSRSFVIFKRNVNEYEYVNVNDQANCFNNSIPALFIENTSTTVSGSCIEDIETKLIIEFGCLHKWLLKNRLSLRVSKTE